jgi:hypothetical protein
MARTKYKVKTIEIVVMSVVLVALVLTVSLVKKQQNTQQEAAISCSPAYSLSFCSSFCKAPKRCTYQSNNSKGTKLYACCSITTPITPIASPSVMITPTKTYTITPTKYPTPTPIKTTTTTGPTPTKTYTTTTTTKQTSWYCTRCSDTYKYARAYWYEGDSVCDRSNVIGSTTYLADCSCTAGTNTSKGYVCAF